MKYQAILLKSFLSVTDLRGARGTPPRMSKFFQFHAVFRKIWQNRMLAPPGELVPPPWGNLGSATAYICRYQTRMHSCRMYTTCLLTVSHSI